MNAISCNLSFQVWWSRSSRPESSSSSTRLRLSKARAENSPTQSWWREAVDIEREKTNKKLIFQIGIGLCFVTTFSLIQKPSHVTCIFSRWQWLPKWWHNDDDNELGEWYWSNIILFLRNNFRILPGTSIALIFAALATKTNRWQPKNKTIIIIFPQPTL